MPSTSERKVDVNKLPSHLSERVRVIHSAPLNVNGDFVLNWMHHSQSKIGLCGDWCQMSRLEGASLSGMAMAGRILSMSTEIQPKQPDLEE